MIKVICFVQYFGGTNFGHTAGGPLVASSYDYDAPIDEYGKSSLNFWHVPSFVGHLHLMGNIVCRFY